MKAYIRLILAIAVCLLSGAIGSVFTAPAIETWYVGLRKPDLAPPNWVFGPVWTILYSLMGISLFVVWSVGFDKSTVRSSIIVFGIQMGLNIIWSFFFFGLKSPLLGLVEIVVLWFAIVLTIFSFFKVSRIAALILIPYLIWVSFASYLNYSILILNL